jgi:hypothetical protein
LHRLFRENARANVQVLILHINDYTFSCISFLTIGEEGFEMQSPDVSTQITPQLQMGKNKTGSRKNAKILSSKSIRYRYTRGRFFSCDSFIG